MWLNGQNRTFTAIGNGTFSFTLDTRYTNEAFSLYSAPDVGYKLEGVYSTSTGEKLSTKKTWHFTPNAAGYEIRFVLNPDSYKYTLIPGDDVAGDKDYKADYLTAAMKRLQELATEPRTLVLYESPYRVVKCLEQIAETMGEERRVAVVREITKKFEETVRGSVAEVLAHFREHEPKGEFVIVVAGYDPKAQNTSNDQEQEEEE